MNAVCAQFCTVLAAAEANAWAHPSILSPRLQLEFDGARNEHTCLIWEDFMASAWERARAHWSARGLPVVGESDGEGGAAPAYHKIAPLSEDEHFWALTPAALKRMLLRGHDVDGDIFRVARVRVEGRVSRGRGERCDRHGRAQAAFPRCRCADEDGKTRVCVPPGPGYQCERVASCMRTTYVTARMRAERDREDRNTVVR